MTSSVKELVQAAKTVRDLVRKEIIRGGGIFSEAQLETLAAAIAAVEAEGEPKTFWRIDELKDDGKRTPISFEYREKGLAEQAMLANSRDVLVRVDVYETILRAPRPEGE